MSSYLPGIVTGPIGYGADLLRGALGSMSWSPAVSISKATVTSLFARIENGTLVVIDNAAGKTEIYGQKIVNETSKMTNGVNGKSRKSLGAGKVKLIVRKDSFWVRLFLFADMGFAEAFMLGEVDCLDLTGFFQVCTVRTPVPMSQYFLLRQHGACRLIFHSCLYLIVANWRMQRPSRLPLRQQSRGWQGPRTHCPIPCSTSLRIMISATRCSLLSFRMI